MKKLLIALMAASILAACSKENKSATVIKNCTGTYLQVDNKIHRVCNYEILDEYSEGEEVEVSFETSRNCEAYDTLILCEMLFEYNKDIRISSVK